MSLLPRTRLLVKVPDLDEICLQHLPHVFHWFLSLSKGLWIPTSSVPSLRCRSQQQQVICSAFVQCCRHTWVKMQNALLGVSSTTSAQPTSVASQLHIKPLDNMSGFLLKTCPRQWNHASCVSFLIAKVVNPVAVTLKLPRSLGISPTFHRSISWR